MGRKEKYYNHIVDNVVKNTIMIDHIKGDIKFPDGISRYIYTPQPPHYIVRPDGVSFVRHVTLTYGAKPEETGNIYNLYSKTLESLFKK